MHEDEGRETGHESADDFERIAVRESIEPETTSASAAHETTGESDAEATRKSSVAYAAGLTIFFSVLSFMGIGWLLDRWLETGWLMVAGIILGSVVGFYEFIRIISKIK